MLKDKGRYQTQLYNLYCVVLLMNSDFCCPCLSITNFYVTDNEMFLFIHVLQSKIFLSWLASGLVRPGLEVLGSGMV